MTGGYEFIEEQGLPELMDQELAELMDQENDFEDQDLDEIEHDGWWADGKDRVRCWGCKKAIKKALASPDNVNYAKVARSLCLTNGQPTNARCAEVGKPLPSNQPDWEHVKAMTGGYEFTEDLEFGVSEKEYEELQHLGWGSWWRKKALKLRCWTCAGAIKKTLASPTSKTLAKAAQQFCLTNGEPITDKCADVGKPLPSE